MKRPSNYMIMTDGVTQQDYINALNKYIDFLEAKTKESSQKSKNDLLPDVSNHVCRTCNGTGLVYVDEVIKNTLCPDC